jgi:hypothetical protein
VQKENDCPVRELETLGRMVIPTGECSTVRLACGREKEGRKGMSAQ